MPLHAVFNFIIAVVEDLWTPFKQLYQQIQSYLVSNEKEINLTGFETLLRKNKLHFSSFLTNPVSVVVVAYIQKDI
jgi:hypothetical protein